MTTTIQYAGDRPAGPPTAPMKALTVRQPWATLIALGIKRIETRTRDTKHRGPLAIHAAATMPCRIGQRLRLGDFEVERDSRTGLLLRSDTLAWPYRLPVREIVALTTLFQTRSTDSGEHSPDEREITLGDHTPGWWAWSLSSVVPVRHSPVLRGQLGIWTVPPTAAATIAAQDSYHRTETTP